MRDEGLVMSKERYGKQWGWMRDEVLGRRGEV